MNAQSDWAAFLRSTTAGFSLSLATFMATPTVQAVAPLQVPTNRATRPLSVTLRGYPESELLPYNRPVYGDLRLDPIWSESEWLPTEMSEGTTLPGLAEELRQTAKLSVTTLAQLAGVSRATYHEWLRGGGMTVDNVNRLERILAAIRTLRSIRGDGLRAFLLTPTEVGRPLDLLRAGDDHAVIGLALRASPRAVTPTIVTAARQASGLPGRLQAVGRLAPAGRRSRVDWLEARERLTRTSLSEMVLTDEFEDDTPSAVAHILFEG